MSHTAVHRLVACGALVGPLFIAVVVVQALTRSGYDLAEHPISLLTLGEFGWIQSANFVVAGVLAAAFAVGVRRALRPGRGARWTPLLIGVFGVGLVVAGVFRPDPSYGFPPGSPEGTPEELSTSATLHGVGFALAMGGFILACLVLARRDLRGRDRGWASYSAVSAVAALVLAMWPSEDAVSIRFFVATLVTFAWTAAVALRLRAGVESRREVDRHLAQPAVAARHG
jgi:Protein of unknown function (DUF998)